MDTNAVVIFAKKNVRSFYMEVYRRKFIDRMTEAGTKIIFVEIISEFDEAFQENLQHPLLIITGTRLKDGSRQIDMINHVKQLLKSIPDRFTTPVVITLSTELETDLQRSFTINEFDMMNDIFLFLTDAELAEMIEERDTKKMKTIIKRLIEERKIKD